MTSTPGPSRDDPARGHDPAPGDPAVPCPDDPEPGGLAGLAGSVNLTMPATAWLGLTDSPRRDRRDRRRHLPRPG